MTRGTISRPTGLLALALFVSCDPRDCFGGGGGSESPSSGTVVISFVGTTAADPALMLYSGMRGGNCVTYEVHVGNPTVTIDGITVDPACPAELDAFAPTLGAYGVQVDPADPASDDWLETAIVSGSLAVTMPGPTTVPLRLWVLATSDKVAMVEGVRNRLLDKAYPVYARLGTGFTFDTASTVLSPSVLTARCASAGAISTNPSIYDASRLNVYFVEYYGNTPGLSPARNCWMNGHNEIMFISWGNENLTDPTLAHEVGHALGLILPKSLGGHTYAVPGFDPFNLMATNTDVTDATIGQLYALNFSNDSWINKAGSPLAKPVRKTCADSWDGTPCPTLTLSHPGWPP